MNLERKGMLGQSMFLDQNVLEIDCMQVVDHFLN